MKSFILLGILSYLMRLLQMYLELGCLGTTVLENSQLKPLEEAVK